MTEVIYLLTVLYATYVIDDVIGDMQLYLLVSFAILLYMIGL